MQARHDQPNELSPSSSWNRRFTHRYKVEGFVATVKPEALSELLNEWVSEMTN